MTVNGATRTIPPMMLLWHRTARASVESILKEGFRDSAGSHLTEQEPGIWLSDRPLDDVEGAIDCTLLRVELRCTDTDISVWERVDELKGYREWLIPANFVNRHTTTIATEL